MMCFKESLRIEPPLPMNSAFTVTKDVVLAKGTPKELKVTAGDELHVFMSLLHHNESQWGPKHREFIPERWDSKSEHYLTPSGKPRHAYSFAPFFGGHRMCLGKTFAETVAKKMITMILKFYTLELADPEMKK